MKRADKIAKKKENSIKRAKKNGRRNKGRRNSNNLDCPYDVDMNGLYGTCHCGGANYDDCAGDI